MLGYKRIIYRQSGLKLSSQTVWFLKDALFCCEMCQNAGSMDLGIRLYKFKLEYSGEELDYAAQIGDKWIK